MLYGNSQAESLLDRLKAPQQYHFIVKVLNKTQYLK